MSEVLYMHQVIDNKKINILSVKAYLIAKYYDYILDNYIDKRLGYTAEDREQFKKAMNTVVTEFEETDPDRDSLFDSCLLDVKDRLTETQYIMYKNVLLLSYVDWHTRYQCSLGDSRIMMKLLDDIDTLDTFDTAVLQVLVEWVIANRPEGTDLREVSDTVSKFKWTHKETLKHLKLLGKTSGELKVVGELNRLAYHSYKLLKGLSDTKDKEVNKLKGELTRLESKITKFNEERDKIKQESKDKTKELKSSKAKLNELEKRIAKLKKENAYEIKKELGITENNNLKAENKSLSEEITNLKEENQNIKKTNQKLEERIKQLEESIKEKENKHTNKLTSAEKLKEVNRDNIRVMNTSPEVMKAFKQVGLDKITTADSLSDIQDNDIVVDCGKDSKQYTVIKFTGKSISDFINTVYEHIEEKENIEND